ncbi:hypothetical protein [Plantactinospora soyae]|uniref:Uncharacterized protein n=1 Tax=Plantactinospora soyae TaxID=1544732 RepID=A0A927R4K6_9ACTN|nr:hypothetical protein [Plantactinospora soyae]MBE1485071.1 hypothetical protein [Plantactinospora soyae]
MTAAGASWLEQVAEQSQQNVSEGLERVQQLTVELADGLTAAMRWLPLGIGTEAIEREWQRFLELKDRLFDELQRLVEEPGFPPALWRIGEYWNVRIGAPVSGLQQKVSPNELDADGRWGGTAADSYRDAALAQADALKTIGPATEKIQSALDDLAWGLVAFWVAIAAAVATFVIGMVSAAGATATVIGAPAAPPMAGGTVVAVGGLVVAALVALVDYTERFDNTMTSLAQVLNDNTGMVEQPGGTFGWPTMETPGNWSVRTD